MNLGGNAAPIVLDGHAALDMNRHDHAITDAGEGLVYRVVDHVEYEVVKAPFGGVSDVHSGPFADGLKAFENPYRVCTILGTECVLVVHRHYQKTVLFDRFFYPLNACLNLREKLHPVKLW